MILPPDLPLLSVKEALERHPALFKTIRLAIPKLEPEEAAAIVSLAVFFLGCKK